MTKPKERQERAAAAPMDHIDRTPRYAPSEVQVRGLGVFPVTSHVVYPPGKHPPGTPIVASMTVLELKTAQETALSGMGLRYRQAPFVVRVPAIVTP